MISSEPDGSDGERSREDMAASKDRHDAGPSSRSASSPRTRPQWGDGLKKLYDSVVEEPLPDSFQDLLDKLDDDS